MGILSVFISNIALPVCLFVSVCNGQNVLSMVHLIILICLPFFHSTKSNNSNAVPRTNERPRKHQFLKATFIVVLIILLLKIVNAVAYITMLQYQAALNSHDNVVGRTMKILGFAPNVNQSFGVPFDGLLTVVAFVSYYLHGKENVNSATSDDVHWGSRENAQIYDDDNRYLLSVFKYSCLAVVGFNGIVVPSVACFFYYVSFMTITTLTILFKLDDRMVVCLFRTICLYTCLHMVALFAYQIPWVRDVDIYADLVKKFGLMVYYDFQKFLTQDNIVTKLKDHHFILPITLIIQHHALWMYTGMININMAVRQSTKPKKLDVNKFGLENMILIGIKTIGFKIVILVWSVYYRGWLTLAMLLWTTIAWIYLHSRRNIVISLLFAISTLLVEYTYIILGDDRLKQVFGSNLRMWKFKTRDDFPIDILIKTLFTVTFWIALDQSDKNQRESNNRVSLELLSADVKKYISIAWITSLIWIMFVYSFFGYTHMNFIRLGYILLTLLFLIVFQFSYEMWRKIATIYWRVVILYSIVVVTITYAFQFYGFANTLGNVFYLSDTLQCNIGLCETGDQLIIVPAMISIATIVYLKYLHEPFMNTLNVRRKTLFFDTTKTPQDIQMEPETHLSIIQNAIKLVFYVHLNKLKMLLVVFMALSKPCLVNGILLVMILLWASSDYNNCIMRILFLHITLYLILTFAYQFSYIDHENWIIHIQYKEKYGTFKLNIAELLGLNKCNTNELLFNFLIYELLILLTMVLKNIITIHLKFKHYPQQVPTLIFPDITIADMNSGLAKFIMYLVNNGFSLFGLEITLTLVAIVISLSMDVYALVCSLCLLIFSILNRQTVSKYWSYFITFMYLTAVLKYLLAIIYAFDFQSVFPWQNIKITQHLTIVLYDLNYTAWIKPLTPYDFILLILASRQSMVFRNDRLNALNKIENQRDNINNRFTANEEYPDYMSQTKSYLDIFKRIVFNNSLWIILFFMFWNGTNNINVNLFSLGYLCAGTMFFWKGTYYFLMPLHIILKLWRLLLIYSILVMFFKVLFHLLGCLILNYFQWYSCAFMGIFCFFCPQQLIEERQVFTCGILKQDIGLSWDVCTFMLVLYQMRFLESGHFYRLVEDTKAVATLATKMGNIVKEWGRKRKDENSKVGLDLLEKIKVKLQKILDSKEKRAKKQLNHSQACSDGEYMFEEIYDDVYLVEKHDTELFPQNDDSIKGPWLYRQFIYFVLYLSERIDEFSIEHRKIVQTLYTEKKLLMLQQDQTREDLSQSQSQYQEYQTQYEDSEKPKHWLMIFILTLYNLCHASTHLLCYLAIFYNAVKNYYNFISLTPVVLVMFWGQLSVPRPTKSFWIVLITYMQVTGLIKYICSFKEVPWTNEEIGLQNIRTSEFYSYPTVKLGIGDFQKKIPTDIIVLLFLYLHRRTLIRLGLWGYNNDHRRERILQNKDNTKTTLRTIVTNIKMHLTPMTEFYFNIRQYHTHGSVNVYPIMFILIAIQIPCCLLKSQSTTGIFTLNRVSTTYFTPIITHTITIVIDRWLYSRRYILGKLIFHVVYVCVFIYILMKTNMEDNNFLNYFWAYTIYLYIIVSAYQVRHGYLYRNASSFIWSRYTVFNLLVYKLYYYCPFVHEIRTMMDWIWTDSSLTIMEWFKMEEMFAHVCCVKCIWKLRDLLDTKRGEPLSRLFKLLLGGGIVIAILTIIIFPVLWFSMFVSTPDTPSSIEFTITLGEDSTIFSTKSDDIHMLDATDYNMIQKLYSNSSSQYKMSNLEFLNQYQFDEISSVNVIPQSINTWSITMHEFIKFKTILLTSSSIKVSVTWALTHHDGVKVSRGKNTVIMDKTNHELMKRCLYSIDSKITKIRNSNPCKQKIIVHDLIPKFLILHAKSFETEVKSELMMHKPLHPYMNVALTFHYDEESKFTYFWEMEEMCPFNENALYLRKMPYSSCAFEEIKSGIINNNTMYNIYVFSDRFSDTLQFLDDKGIIGLYTIIVVYVGYKLAFDIFRSFKFKMGFTETPYPDRILQLCYEIYLVRFFEEYEMEENLYAMLIFLFRSPETLIRYTRRPNT